VTEPTRAQLLEAFRQAAREVAERDFGHVSESTRLRDLDIDSLAMAEILVLLEQRVGRSIPEQQVAALRTVGDVLDRMA
jgi:acyl carrier protein